MSEHNSNQPIPESDQTPRVKVEPTLTGGSAAVAANPSFPAGSERRNNFSKWLSLSFLALALLVAAGVRVRLLDFPLERDEGEYAYAGQLITEGIPPYQLAYNMKMPGTYLAYAGVMSLFGQTTAGIHLGLLVIHLATLAVLFLIARKLLDLPGAVIATAACALMTLSPAYFGLAAHATHFVMLPALLGVWMLFRVEKDGRLLDCLVAGGLFGVAFLMKQQGMFFGTFGGLYLAWASVAGNMARSRVVMQLGLYALGCLLPFLAVCLWLAMAGVFPAFWFWTVAYAREYVRMTPFHDGVGLAESALANIGHAAPLLWVVAGAGLACLCLTRQSWNTRIFLGGFLLFSGLAVCPGLYFRGHYFIVLVPAVALLAGLAVSWSGRFLANKYHTPGLGLLPFLLGALACAQSLQADRAVLFSLPPREACRAVYHVSSFPEAPAIARYIEQNTRKDQSIVVIGSEPEIYFQARRHSSTGYIYAYPLMEEQPFARTMQEDMIREIKQNPPACLVVVSLPESWGFQQDSSHELLDWVADDLNLNLQQVGLVQYPDEHTTETVWGPGAATTPIHSEYYVAVFKRAEAGGAGDPNSPARSENTIARNKLLMDLFYHAQDDATIHHLQEILRGNPNFALAHENLAGLLARQGQIDDAIREYQEAIRLQPDNAEAHYNLGGILLQQGQADAAIHEFQADLLLKPNDAEAHYNLGNLLVRSGQVGAAIGQFREAIRLQPDDAIAHNNLGLLLTGTGQTAAALSQFQEALRLMPDNAQIHYNFGNSLVKAGQTDEAISQFQEVLRLKPDFANAQGNLEKALALKNNGPASGTQ